MTNINDINKKKFQCTLAKEYVKYQDKIDFSNKNWIGQTKFNGCRCIITKNGAHSRTGEKFLTINHITNEFKHVFEKYPDAVIDGELFNYDLREQLNELISIVRKSVNITLTDTEKSKQIVQYHVYDGYLNEDYKNSDYFTRFSAIQELLIEHKYTQLVNHILISNTDDLNKFYQSQLQDNQEGIILRNIDAIYEQKRSKNLLKYKPVDDDEAIILKVNEGLGNWSNCAKTATIKWKNKTFDATFLGTQEELRKVLKNKHTYVNKLIKFKYNGLTGLGIPNFARIDLKNSSSIK